jgi:hypothetical protein
VKSGTNSALEDTRNACRIFVVTLKPNIFGKQDEVIKKEFK